MPYANGVEVSDDGTEFYIASSGLMNVTAFSNTNPAQVLRRTETFPIIPDNLHNGRDGKLVTAGLNLVDPVCGDVLQSSEFDLGAFAACNRPFTVLAVDAETMATSVLESAPALEHFSNITMALEVGDELWLGTFFGDRVAYRKLADSSE